MTLSCRTCDVPRHAALGVWRGSNAGGGAISWFLRVPKVAEAATSESMDVALAETVNELLFLREVTEFIVPPIDIDIKIHEDNQGAIKMATNRFSSRRTRHVDVKHHNICGAIKGRG